MYEECCQTHSSKLGLLASQTMVVKGLSTFPLCLRNVLHLVKKWCGALRCDRKTVMLDVMGITHCPICVGLAVLSAVRFMAHAVMAYQLERANADSTTHPATVLGTLFEL